ncbi:sensor histidine kinase [Shimia sagamensis]|uniref:histidine kinase n=1 Tax=Shimia sagamensis TaxID=1566352 RepID=A0ABY1PBS6_9RHOB|nr:ATP-binding protein [Shimia sagamensis]SMP30180.1 two-component system, NtrC family, C4-dicarboxylate transport sensor histidine kinase DctB [Shimia sagamensis]
MRTWIRHRATILILFFLMLIAVASGVWRYGYVQALDQLARRGEADLALAADRLTAQLQRYQELAVLMAEHPTLLALSEHQSNAQPSADLLLEVADKTAALDLIYASADGTILATAQEDAVPSQNLTGAPYFTRALHGAIGTHHAVDARFNQRAFYFSAPSFGADGKVTAVLTVVVDMADVEGNWRGDGPAVYFVDDAKEVFITNRSELLFWNRPIGDTGLAPPDAPAPVFSSQNTAGYEIWQMDWGAYIPERGLHIVKDLPIIDLVAEAIVDVSFARRIAGLQAGAIAAVVMVFGLILLQVLERRRVLAQANAELEERVTIRTKALSTTNEALRREITEREEAEAALKKAQADLVQAGKLSALGQMSAGISHELNQPLQAIQTFADNGTRFLDRANTEKAGENLTRISQMATRMARIIKNLRAFARNENEPMGRVDLVATISQAVELTELRLNQDNINLSWAAHSYNHPIYALGGEVRLAQVFVNLINNAADAMSDSEERQIDISIVTAPRLCVNIRDTGPGIDAPDKIFDPFYTTKEVGSSEGMGLGLSISYGLVQSFGGNIRGSNLPAGGALFTVELDQWQEESPK